MRLRSVVAIGTAGEGLSETLASTADALLLTLATDARPVQSLRNTAIEALHRINEAEKCGLVLVNNPRTNLLRDDLAAVVSHNVNGVFLPHVTDPQEVRDAAVLLREFELARGIEPGAVALFPLVDTARGLLRANEIIGAAPRVGGLVFAQAAYARDTGARLEERGERLSYARGKVVAVARAYDRLPLVVSDGLELQNLAQYGFAGAVLAESRFAANANNMFAPSDAAMERAKRHLEVYDEARAKGEAVARFGDELVDAHGARRARQTTE